MQRVHISNPPSLSFIQEEPTPGLLIGLQELSFSYCSYFHGKLVIRDKMETNLSSVLVQLVLFSLFPLFPCASLSNKQRTFNPLNPKHDSMIQQFHNKLLILQHKVVNSVRDRLTESTCTISLVTSAGFIKCFWFDKVMT